MKVIVHTYKTILFILLLLSFGSCESWLHLEPQDAIIKDKYWQTKEQVEAAVFGVYASLLGTTDGARSVPEFMFLWGEMRGDMVNPNTRVLNDELEVINGNLLQTNSLADWRVFYRTINYCNTVIDLAPGVLKTDPTFKESQLNAYLSEMLTIRSLLYFYLVRTFKEVPLKIKATVSDSDPFDIPKSSEEEILQQIISDLIKAESIAVTSYGNIAHNKGRVTRFMVNALQADVYLWHEEYEKCKAACDKVINSGQFGLVTGDRWFRDIFVVGNSNESIFELQFDEEKLNPFFNIFVNPNGRWLAHPDVLDILYTQDTQDPDNRDVRAENASLKGDGRIWKYLGLNTRDARSTFESYAHWIVYRFADIYLMKAEAAVMLGNDEEAIELMDKIRIRANALEGTEQFPDDVEGWLLYILDERAREFAFEGKRWFDILRHARRNNYSNINYLIELSLKTAPAERQQSIINKLRDTNSHYLPIFQYELQTNKALVQNPFYTK